MSNTQYLPPMGLPQPGTPTYGGGGRVDIVGARSILDARRMAASGRVPSAEYPDGYLGTQNSRRADRLNTGSGTPVRTARQSYDKGVHVGERLDPQSYLWPSDVNPMVALKAQAKGKKWTQSGGALEGRHLVGGGVVQMSADDAERAAQLRSLVPKWR